MNRGRRRRRRKRRRRRRRRRRSRRRRRRRRRRMEEEEGPGGAPDVKLQAKSRTTLASQRRGKKLDRPKRRQRCDRRTSA
jgi:hypothetical protein